MQSAVLAVNNERLEAEAIQAGQPILCPCVQCMQALELNFHPV